jgi:hypothetical protein
VWANPSGRTTAEINAVPVRLKRDGRWLDFDTTLQRRSDGRVVPRVHPGDLVFAGRTAPGEHDLATIDVAGERIGLGWSGALPEPILAGAKATYPEVLLGVDLVLEARSVGFAQFNLSDNQSEPILKLGYSDDSSCVNASPQRCRARSYLRSTAGRASVAWCCIRPGCICGRTIRGPAPRSSGVPPAPIGWAAVCSGEASRRGRSSGR